MNRRSFFSILKAGPVAAVVAVTPPAPKTATVISYSGWVCKCGMSMWAFELDGVKRMKCVHQVCPQFDIPLEIPTFEAKRV